MKRDKKLFKILSVVLIILIIFNISPFGKVRADATSIADRVDVGSGVSEDNYDSMMDKGTVKTEPSGSDPDVKSIKDSMSFGKTATKILSLLIIAIPVELHELMTLVASDGESSVKLYSIADTIAGNYNIFDIKFWDFNADTKDAQSITDSIKSSVSSWYVGMRNLSAVLMIIIALYIGMRMAISTAAEDQARYKSMFIDWFKGIILLFFIHYIMIGIVMLSDKVVDIINLVGGSVDKGREIEYNIVENTLMNALLTKGSNTLSKYSSEHPLYNAIVYLVMIIMYFKFFKLYFYRMLKVMFMVIISPIMCATYAIDKIGDNRSQAFDHFFTEFLTLVFKQPIHLLLYMVFIASAGSIIEQAELLLIVFFFAMGSMEKMVEKIIINGKSKLVRGLNEMKIKDDK